MRKRIWTLESPDGEIVAEICQNRIRKLMKQGWYPIQAKTFPEWKKWIKLNKKKNSSNKIEVEAVKRCVRKEKLWYEVYKGKNEWLWKEEGRACQ